MAEALATKYHEGKFPTEQFMMSIEDSINVIPTDMLPPAISAMMGYMVNKDFWTKQDIWRGPKVEAAQEYDLNRTNAMFRGVGALGLSPARTEYAVNRIVPMNNPFVALVGGGFKTITGQLGEEWESKSMEQILTENPSIKRVFKSTSPYTQYREDIEDLKVKENTRRFVQNRELDDMLEKHFSNPTTETAKSIQVAILNAPEEDQDRLIDRVIKTKEYYNIPDRSWWLNIASLPPETRAVAFWSRYNAAPEKEKQQLSFTLTQIDGIASDRFIDKLTQLVAQAEKFTSPSVVGEAQATGGNKK